ncbi:2TM domain-containing protein [Flagellimonas meridianipacifica]|uniref:2TM domain-containing protein n=1 Tax=Flagellimonas meridianipacifica TaxID=1080225 RepID=A0A2T0MA10_9FLAO|nr:2TM domain-containing protein [Allomuricauda pacifica]PRX54313.1 2TM domain-containing protein [Allomuricauda pacifica]
MEPNTNEAKYIKAKERVAKMRKFYGSLTWYLVVITGLGALNYYLNEWSYMWFLWAAFGWGIGLFFQAIKAFNLNPFFGKAWEERKIREYMDKEEDNEIKKWR